MSLHVSLGAWEVKGSGAVWISDANHKLLMQRAEAVGADLVLRLRNPHIDSAYAPYELRALAAQLESLAAQATGGDAARPALLPSAGGIDELLVQLADVTHRALEWQTDIIVRADGTIRSAR